MPGKQRATRVGVRGGIGAGMGVDAHGGPVIDPTENVLALVEAAVQRQDDLRITNDKRIEQHFGHVEMIAQLRADQVKAMQEAEAMRLNSIRQVDVLAVSTAADRALSAIQTLAATTAANAENLRSALTATAATIATQLDRTVAGINERLAALERSSYEGKGKEAMADPQMERLSALVESLARQQSTGAGKSAGIGTAWAVALGVIGLVSSLLVIGGVVVSIVLFTSRSAGAPIYVPAPAGTALPSNPPGPTPR